MASNNDFTDPKSICPPQNLQKLIEQLHQVFARDNINVDYVKALMESYTSDRAEWEQYAKFDPKQRYTRNLVDEGNGKFNLLILCWNEEKGSSIHSHANSHCFMKILSGTAKEEQFEWPTSREQRGGKEMGTGERAEMKLEAENTFQQDQCTYICDDLGLHRVQNPSRVDKTVTLHLYSPPFTECFSFDQSTGSHETVSMTLWSKYGELTSCEKESMATEQEKK